MYYLGVDGGGTKTKYILVNDSGDVVNEFERGTTHIQQIGKENLEKELIKAKEIILENNIDIKEIKSAFFGIPGYGEIKSDKEIIDGLVEKVFKDIDYRVGNDSEVAWAAGTECKEGINIVAGTGSIAYGKNSKGTEGRCGGWGPGIGDDGSAYAIGLKVINEYTKQKDGRSVEGPLVSILEESQGIKDYFEIVDIVFKKLAFSRTELAKFSAIGAKAANSGCVACQIIFNDAGIELAKHISSLSKTLELEDGFVVSYTGGVFNSGELVLNGFKKYLEENNIKCTVQSPKLKPWEGAVLLAKNI